MLRILSLLKEEIVRSSKKYIVRLEKPPQYTGIQINERALPKTEKEEPARLFI